MSLSGEDLRALERKLFLEAVWQVHGYDFRDYAEASLNRRLEHWLARSPYSTFSEAQGQVLRDPEALAGLIQGIAVQMTELFRDPAFFLALRQHVVPHLRTHPLVRIWVAGCASGEEAYSLAILLREEGLDGRFRIYATDLDPAALDRARQGLLPLKAMQAYTRNYQHSGGLASLADYYSAGYDHALLMPSLREGIVFASHNLATDADFTPSHLILCRNVLLYFRQPLRQRALALFDASLAPGGFLCLGLKESLAQDRRFPELVTGLRIYRKPYAPSR